jgi:hypothetical protein
VAYVWPAAFAEDALLSDPVLDGLIDSGVDLFGRYSESAIQDTRRHFHKS